MRVLSKRTDLDGESATGQKSKAHRLPDPAGDERCPLPLHDLLPHSICHQTRRKDNGSEARRRMTPAASIPKHVEAALSRRNLLKSAGMLVVVFAGFIPREAI